MGVRLSQPGGTSSLARTPLALECVLPKASACVRRQGREYNMKKYRNYWAYSIACFVVWGVVLAVRASAFGNSSTRMTFSSFLPAGALRGFRPPSPGRFTLHQNAGSSRRVRPLPEPPEQKSAGHDGICPAPKVPNCPTVPVFGDRGPWSSRRLLSDPLRSGCEDRIGNLRRRLCTVDDRRT